jgi:transitional endoplasmic reticulum ATPase
MNNEIHDEINHLLGRRTRSKKNIDSTDSEKIFFYYINSLITNKESVGFLSVIKNIFYDYIEESQRFSGDNDVEENNIKNKKKIKEINIFDYVSEYKERIHLKVPYENSILYLKEEFSIDDLSEKFLYLYFDSFAIKHLSRLINSIIEKEPLAVKLLSCLLNCSKEDVESIFIKNSKLVENGIVTDNETDFPDELFGDYGRYIIAKELYKKMNSYYKNKNVFFESIIGSTLKATLSWEDYDNVVPEKNFLCKLLEGQKENPIIGMNIMFRGIPGLGKTEFCKTLAIRCGYNIWSVAESNEQNDDPKPYDRLQILKFSLAFIKKRKNSILMFDEAEDILNIPDSRLSVTRNGFSKIFINRLLEKHETPIIWVCNDIEKMHLSFVRRMTYIMEFSVPGLSIRENIWNKFLKTYKNIDISQNNIKTLASKWKSPPSIVENAVKAVDLACGNFHDLDTAISNSMKCFEIKENIIFKPNLLFNISYINCSHNINEITKQILSSKSQNWSMCIEGKPGTGKSEYGKYLSNKMEITVIEYKSGDLLGKFVGETEQKIKDAFEEASKEKALLIFDEVDSLLFSRDRSVRSFEISQVNSFLIELEKYKYPIVCTTNHFDMLDTAALRRFVFKLKFESLNDHQFYKIFKEYFKLDCNHRALKNAVIGDFACVLRKESFLNTNNEKQIYNWIQEEIELRNDSKSNQIGFVPIQSYEQI